MKNLKTKKFPRPSYMCVSVFFSQAPILLPLSLPLPLTTFFLRSFLFSLSLCVCWGVVECLRLTASFLLSLGGSWVLFIHRQALLHTSFYFLFATSIFRMLLWLIFRHTLGLFFFISLLCVCWQRRQYLFICLSIHYCGFSIKSADEHKQSHHIVYLLFSSVITIWFSFAFKCLVQSH